MEELGRHFDALAAQLRVDASEALSSRIAACALAAIPSADHSGLTFVREGRRPRTLVASSDVVNQVDELQYQRRTGPCLEAADRAAVVRVDDLAAESRWAGFGPACAESTGIRSLLWVRLRLDGADRAAMNLYSAAPRAFSSEDEATAVLFAPFVALALAHELERRRSTELETALHSSRQIGMAIGIVMSRELLTEEQAFARLVEASQHLNVKLRDIAVRVNETGQLPRDANV